LSLGLYFICKISAIATNLLLTIDLAYSIGLLRAYCSDMFSRLSTFVSRRLFSHRWRLQLHLFLVLIALPVWSRAWRQVSSSNHVNAGRAQLANDERRFTSRDPRACRLSRQLAARS